MKRLVTIFLIPFIFSFCGTKQEKVEKIIEDGVKVVLNHLEPYKIKGEPSNLVLEEEFTIDTESEYLLKVGLTDIETFDVDPEGSIFIIRWRTSENYIFKFDKNGNFITSFLRFGQGPGEIEWGGTLLVNKQNEIIAKDPSKMKFLVYTRNGSFIRETHLKERFGLVQPLENGDFLISWQRSTPDLIKDRVGLCSSEFEITKELDIIQRSNPMTANRIKVGRGRITCGASKDKIYVGNAEKGYEIRVYDLEGNLLQKIRKDYKPVEISEEFKKEYLNRRKKSLWLDKYYFAKHWPPFQYLFTDDDGRLYIMTYEEGINPGEFMYDIFSPEGIFIGRTSLGNYEEPIPFTAMAKKNRLYCLKKKESGYKELTVYKMKWE